MGLNVPWIRQRALRQTTRLIPGVGVQVPSLHQYASRQRHYHEISFSERGEPATVLEYHSSSFSPSLPSNNASHYVEVEMLAAPWNPADRNTVQGKYPSPLTPQQQAKLLRSSPSMRGEAWQVAGSEGLGRIVSDEASSQRYSPGTLVTLGRSGMGTHRSSLWLPQDAVIPLKRGEELVAKVGPGPAASLFQLGGTALRMLQDFENVSSSLPSGSVKPFVLQNAGNSGVGWMVSQLAAARKIDVLSLVRRGTKSVQEFDQLVKALTNNHTNTTHVVAEEDLEAEKETMKALQLAWKEQNQQPILALNCVGGASTLLKLLAPGGTMVTYGGMSMQPLTVSTSQLIFKDVRVRGYWHSRWMIQNTPSVDQQDDPRDTMINELVDAVLDHGVHCPPIKMFPLSLFREALEFEGRQSIEAIRSKVIFDCTEAA